MPEQEAGADSEWLGAEHVREVGCKEEGWLQVME